MDILATKVGPGRAIGPYRAAITDIRRQNGSIVFSVDLQGIGVRDIFGYKVKGIPVKTELRDRVLGRIKRAEFRRLESAPRIFSEFFAEWKNTAVDADYYVIRNDPLIWGLAGLVGSEKVALVSKSILFGPSTAEKLIGVFHEDAELFAMMRWSGGTSCADRAEEFLEDTYHDPGIILTDDLGNPVPTDARVDTHVFLRGAGWKTRGLQPAMFNIFKYSEPFDPEQFTEDFIGELASEYRLSYAEALPDQTEKLIRLNAGTLLGQHDLDDVLNRGMLFFGLQDWMDPAANYALSRKIARMSLSTQEDFEETSGSKLFLPIQPMEGGRKFWMMSLLNEGRLAEGEGTEARCFLMERLSGEHVVVKAYHPQAPQVLSDEELDVRAGLIKRLSGIRVPGARYARIYSRSIPDSKRRLHFYCYEYIDRMYLPSEAGAKMTPGEGRHKNSRAIALLHLTHMQDFVHGDPTSKNIILSKSGEVVFIDYETRAMDLQKFAPDVRFRLILKNWALFWNEACLECPGLENDLALREVLSRAVREEARRLLGEAVRDMDDHGVIGSVRGQLEIIAHDMNRILKGGAVTINLADDLSGALRP